MTQKEPNALSIGFDTRFIVLPDRYSRWRLIAFSWLDLLFKAGVWALLLWQLIFQVSEVKGGSMLDSFRPGDRLVIDKATPKIRAVRRGDVIVFRGLRETMDGRVERADFIKRVIGLPGDSVDAFWSNDDETGIFRHTVRVNTVPFTETNEARLTTDGIVDLLIRPDFIGNGSDVGVVSEVRRVVVPENRFFVLGDNRVQSRDSRVPGEFGDIDGLVHRTDIIGVVRVRLMPWSQRRVY
ncbi:MAG: signal peptidase I [Planctomycetota bacterium]